MYKRIAGLVWGSAVADALGEHYDGQGTVDDKYLLTPDTIEFKNATNDWTDDTDQTIILLDVLSRNKMTINPIDVAKQLNVWHKTNFQYNYPNYERKRHIGIYTNFILSQSDFLTNPVNSCLKSNELMGGDHAANGAIMRNAICGTTRNWQINTLMHCIVTHPDSRCIASCIVQSYIINCIVQEKQISWSDIYAICKAYIATRPHDARNLNEFKKYFKVGIAYKPGTIAFRDYLQTLHIGNYSKNDGQCYTLLAMALCIIITRDMIHSQDNTDTDPDSDVINNNNYYECIIKDIISLGGDADTNACVVGAIIGVFVGADQIPWKDRIMNREFMSAKINQFYKAWLTAYN